MSVKEVSVFFDHQCYWERYGGVSRYFTEILKTDIEDADYQLALKYSNNEYLRELDFECKPFLDNVCISKKHYAISAANKPNSVRMLRRTNANIVHLTHYDPYLFKHIHKKIVVSTIHDLNFFAIPEFFGRQTELLKTWQIRCINNSDKIITISEKTKEDIIKYFKIPNDKITRIYHGINSVFKKTSEERVVSAPYILFVGRRGGYKNFDIVKQSFARIASKYSEIMLVCTGQQFSANEKKSLYAYGIYDRVLHISANEKTLVNLYSNALFFIFPSLYEGFGLPLLEAMSCECPVLCSNASCFPEIAENAVLYFDPCSVEDICEKMIELIEHETFRESLIEMGSKRKESFSWEKSRQEHFEFYKSLL